MAEEGKTAKWRALRLRGLRKRWVVNTVMPVLALLVLISLDVYRYLHDPANVLEGGTLESDRIESERTEGRAGL